MNKILLTESEVDLLHYCLQKGKQKKFYLARELEQCADSGGNGLITPEAARLLSGEHKASAEELYQLSLKLDQAVNVVLEVEE